MEMINQASIQGSDLVFSYEKQDFIKNLNVKIQEGKITTILGPNGSGKSTLLNLMAKQLPLKSGGIVVGNKNICDMKAKEFARKLAVVYQQNSAPADLTVEQLVSFGRTPYQSLFRAESEEEQEAIISWALASTSLEPLRKKNISQLSGGERQRAWIAMALAQKTKILFLDEPTTYLDIYYQVEILELVKKLNEQYGLTIVMVLHDINQALQYSHNVVVMKKGNIVYQGDSVTGITQERIREVYGIEALISYCPVTNCPYLVPIHRISKSIN